MLVSEHYTSPHICSVSCREDTADLPTSVARKGRVLRSVFTRRPGERRVCELHHGADGSVELQVHGDQLPWRHVTPSIWSALRQQSEIERALTMEGWVLTRFCAADVSDPAAT